MEKEIVMLWFYVRKIGQKDFSGFECWESEQMVGGIWYYQSNSRIVRFYINWVWTTLGCHCSTVGQNCLQWERGGLAHEDEIHQLYWDNWVKENMEDEDSWEIKTNMNGSKSRSASADLNSFFFFSKRRSTSKRA